MGTHYEEGCIQLFALFSELLGGIAFAQHIVHVYAFQQMGYCGIAPFDFGADGAFVFFFLHDVHQAQVGSEAYGDVDGQVDGVSGT